MKQTLIAILTVLSLNAQAAKTPAKVAPRAVPCPWRADWLVSPNQRACVSPALYSEMIKKEYK